MCQSIDGGLAGQSDDGVERVRDLRCRNSNDDYLGVGCVATVPSERGHPVAAAAPRSGQTATHMSSTDHNDLHRSIAYLTTDSKYQPQMAISYELAEGFTWH